MRQNIKQERIKTRSQEGFLLPGLIEAKKKKIIKKEKKQIQEKTNHQEEQDEQLKQQEFEDPLYNFEEESFEPEKQISKRQSNSSSLMKKAQLQSCSGQDEEECFQLLKYTPKYQSNLSNFGKKLNQLQYPPAQDNNESLEFEELIPKKKQRQHHQSSFEKKIKDYQCSAQENNASFESEELIPKKQQCYSSFVKKIRDQQCSAQDKVESLEQSVQKRMPKQRQASSSNFGKKFNVQQYSDEDESFQSGKQNLLNKLTKKSSKSKSKCLQKSASEEEVSLLLQNQKMNKFAQRRLGQKNRHIQFNYEEDEEPLKKLKGNKLDRLCCQEKSETTKNLNFDNRCDQRSFDDESNQRSFEDQEDSIDSCKSNAQKVDDSQIEDMKQYIDSYVKEQRKNEDNRKQQKQFKCYFFCGKEFQHQQILFDHKATDHPFELLQERGGKGYLCQFCYKYFERKVNRNNHEVYFCSKAQKKKEQKSSYQMNIESQYKFIKQLRQRQSQKKK